MAEGDAQRRLAAIVAIDVAGYSRLMGADEQGTLATLKAHRDAMTPLVENHEGRLVGQAGDGLLLEFPSVVEAVTCAIEVQAMMAERNEGIPDDKKMLFRVGINLGDVLVDGDDIFGDGVNVAARIEALAPPGGICLSRTVRDNVRDRMDIALEDQGDVEVKNIARPVRVFRVLGEGEEATAPARRAAPWLKYATAAVIVVAAIAGGGFWWWQQQPDFEPADQSKMTYKLPDKPSIAVLPFDNLSGDPEQNTLIASLVNDLVFALSRLDVIFVVDRNSTAGYAGKSVPPNRVAREMGVRYVLNGSVERQGDRLRLTTELIDAVKGERIWSKRYERTIADVFAVRDDITRRVVENITEAVGSGEQTVIPDTRKVDLEAWLLLYEAAEHGNAPSKERLRQGLKALDRAELREPDLAEIHLWRSVLLRLQAQLGVAKDPEANMQAAWEAAQKAKDLDQEHPGVWAALASLYVAQRQFDKGIAAVEKAIELGPNSGPIVGTGAMLYYFANEPAKSIEYGERALRLMPRYRLPWIIGNFAPSYLYLGQVDKAEALFRELAASGKGQEFWIAFGNAYLALIEAGRGNEGAARKLMERALKVAPYINIDIFVGQVKNPKLLADWAETWKRLGLPKRPPSAKPTKPSIAVLPFANLSDDKEQEYFADGMTDDLITYLSKVNGLFVIARNSVFTYKGKNVKVQEVAKDLGVRYVLEGSVRRAGGTVRINAQLIDAETGGHIWAELFDRDMKDIFALQDEVAGKIVAALKVKLTPVEKTKLARKPTENMEAYDSYLKAKEIGSQFSFKTLKKALALYEDAINKDPTFADAYAGDAMLSAGIYQASFWGVMNSTEARRRYEQSVARALKLDPGNVTALSARASMLAIDGKFDEGINIARQIVSSNPNSAKGHTELANILTMAGKVEQAQSFAEMALRLDPKLGPRHLAIVARIEFMKGRYGQARSLYQQIAERAPKSFTGYNGLIASNAQLGQLKEAKASLKTVLGFWPAYNVQFFSILYQHWDKKILDRWLNALRKAGVPEWPADFKGNEAHRLTGQEIKALVYGHRMEGKVKFGGEFQVDTAKNGDWTYLNLSGKFTGTGKGHIVGNLMCLASDKTVMGRDQCHPVFRNPAGTKAGKNEYIFASAVNVWSFSVFE